MRDGIGYVVATKKQLMYIMSVYNMCRYDRERAEMELWYRMRAYGCAYACSILYSSTVKANESVREARQKATNCPRKEGKKKDNKKRGW